jgi:hypothetical protein
METGSGNGTVAPQEVNNWSGERSLGRRNLGSGTAAGTRVMAEDDESFLDKKRVPSSVYHSADDLDEIELQERPHPKRVFSRVR